MKIKLFASILIMTLLLMLIYQNCRKTDLYIFLENIEGYNINLSDSIAQNIYKIVISPKGELSYQRWEIIIDTLKIEKTNKENLIRHLTCSTDFIINNHGWNKDLISDSKRFKIFIIRWELDEPYILPVKEIHFINE